MTRQRISFAAALALMLVAAPAYAQLGGGGLTPGAGLSNIVEDATPQLGGPLDTSGQAINTSEGAAVASAATTNIWVTDGNVVHVTGTTTITSFGTAPRVGASRMVIFDGILTLTDGANLNLLGGLNIITSAGDFAWVYAETTTLFKVIYAKADGTAVVPHVAGKLGVGTNTPNAPLEVVGDAPGNVGGFAGGHLQVRGSGTAANSNAVITGHSSESTNTQIWYFGSTSSSNKDIAFINRQGGTIFFSPNNSEKMRISSGGVSIGTSGLSASAILELSSTTKALLLSRMTTAQRDALTGVNGMIIYNTTTNTMQGYINGAWANM